MAEKNGERVYLVRLYRVNGELQELFMLAPDDKVALDNAQKSFNREFNLLEQENDIPVLEEKLND